MTCPTAILPTLVEIILTTYEYSRIDRAIFGSYETPQPFLSASIAHNAETWTLTVWPVAQRAMERAMIEYALMNHIGN